MIWSDVCKRGALCFVLAAALAGCGGGSGNNNGNNGNVAVPATGVPDLGANASLRGKVVFPADNPWNQDVSTSPVDPNSDAIIATIGTDAGMHADFGSGQYNGGTIGIPYIVVAGTQAPVPVTFEVADESDPGPYPIPATAPIEGGAASQGDRHVLVVDRDHWTLWELFSAAPSSNFSSWTAYSGAKFDLKSNAVRPLDWTSADAAGLPIFPGLVRADEVFERHIINHALRFTVKNTRQGFVFPARHFASDYQDPNLPPMGMRVRLKASFDISRFPASVQVILTALKKYGMFVADNGTDWFISGAPDERWNNDDLTTLRDVHGSDFEVIKIGTVTTN